MKMNKILYIKLTLTVKILIALLIVTFCYYFVKIECGWKVVYGDKNKVTAVVLVPSIFTRNIAIQSSKDTIEQVNGMIPFKSPKLDLKSARPYLKIEFNF